MIKLELCKIMKEKYGYELNCYDSRLNKISNYTFKKILKEFMGDSTDIDITIDKKKYVLEISVIDDIEVDFSILSKQEYINRYGNERWSN